MESKPPLPLAENERIAQWLRQMAELLQAQQANPFRVGAYRRAADTIERLQVSVRDVLADRGPEGLDELPGVGRGIASVIAEILLTGRWTQLDRLRGSLEPAALFRTVPGVGPELAERIHDALGVETLEALEVASHDGRLDSVPGVGPRRAAAIRAALAEILGRSGSCGGRSARCGAGRSEPAAAMLLDVDREYRDKALAGALPTIAPRRFNPGESRGCPCCTRIGAVAFHRALFQHRPCPRARPHARLGGDLLPRRRPRRAAAHGGHRDTRTAAGPAVVRGREAECRAWYEAGGNA